MKSICKLQHGVLSLQKEKTVTIYDKYNICKESDQAVFVSNLTGDLFIIDYRQFMLVHSRRGSKFLSDLGGILFFTNLEYVGEL